MPPLRQRFFPPLALIGALTRNQFATVTFAALRTRRIKTHYPDLEFAAAVSSRFFTSLVLVAAVLAPLAQTKGAERDRSPVDLVLGPSDEWLASIKRREVRS